MTLVNGIPIIDSSAKLRSSDGVMTADNLLAEMDRWSVARAVIAPADEFVAVYNEDGNRQVAGIVRANPDRLTGLAVANPYYGAKALDTLRAAFDDGLAGLYMHPGLQGFHLTDHIIDPLVELCIELDLTIYTHTGTPICAMPFQLAELARRHPDARFVMGHSAWSDFCGYDVIPAANQAPNIWVETSCAMGAFTRLLVGEVGANRVVFGSAYPRSRYEFEISKIVELGFSDDQLRKIMCENAQRLWRVGEP